MKARGGLLDYYWLRHLPVPGALFALGVFTIFQPERIRAFLKKHYVGLTPEQLDRAKRIDIRGWGFPICALAAMMMAIIIAAENSN
jgi:hypothetical protein